jgi:hypothetical protein
MRRELQRLELMAEGTLAALMVASTGDLQTDSGATPQGNLAPLCAERPAAAELLQSIAAAFEAFD